VIAADAFDLALVIALGAGVGASEILSRYRDAPARALANQFGVAYVLVNGIAAGAALGLLHVFDVRFGMDPASDRLRWVRVLAAGTAAMAVLRSSLFTVRAGNEDIRVGGDAFLNVLLRAIDDAIDRKRAVTVLRKASEQMAAVSFVDAAKNLPGHCFAAMRSLSVVDQNLFAADLEKLRASSADDSVKARQLGVLLIKLVGEEVFVSAVKELGDEIKHRPPAAATIMAGVSFEKALPVLPENCYLQHPEDIPEEAKAWLAGELLDLRAMTDIDDSVKALRLGLLLTEVVGEDTLKSAVDVLGDRIRPKP